MRVGRLSRFQTWIRLAQLIDIDTSDTWSNGRPIKTLGKQISNLNLISKVLAFVQVGGPKCTEASTIFEMWLGGLGGRGRR